MISLSIIYCTYNRIEVFEEVLKHLFNTVEDIKQVEVVIVDNNSTDNTASVAQTYSKEYDNVKYVHEKRQGLSIARNRGCDEASGDYVLYLDDDALVPSDLLIKLNSIIEQNSNVNALGGSYIPWYRTGKPKWYNDQYVSKIYAHKGVSILKEDTWTGCIMMIKRELLLKFKFDEALGMTGKKVFYGEETDLQYRLEKAGYPIYATNDLQLEHLVHDYKLNLAWFFKRRKAQAESMVLMNNKRSLLEVLKGFFIGVGLTIVGLVINLPKLLNSNYYKENYILDTFQKPYKWWVYCQENLKSK